MKKNKIIATLASVLLTATIVGCSTNKISGYSIEKMREITDSRVFESSNGTVLPYRIYSNCGVVKSPLVLCLHGAGERGTDNERQMTCGMNNIVDFIENHNKFATVVSPQCQTDRYWKNEETMEALRELVELMVSNGNVDTDRIFVTGFSMGGEGTWVFGLKNTDLISTIVPICGGPLAKDEYSYSSVDGGIVGKNVWAINYFDDGVVNNTYSRYVMGKIWSFETNNTHYTEVIEGGHTCEAYEDRRLLEWMFGTKKHQ